MVKAALLLLLFVAVGASAAAIGDKRDIVEVDRTQVTVAEQDKENNVEEFVIEIAHVEDDIDDADGTVKGERTGFVALKVDVTPAGVVSINGQTVQAGLNQVTVMAQFTSQGDQQNFKPITAVLVSAYVGFESLTDPTTNNAATAVKIQVRVLEVEGDKVWQADVMEQMVEIRADGQVVKGVVVRIDESMSMLPTVAPPTESNDDDNQDEPIGTAPEPVNDDEDEEDKPKHGKPHHGRPPHPHHHRPGPPSDTDGMPPMTAVDPVPSDNFWDNVRETAHEWKSAAFEWYHSLPFFLRVVIAFAFGMLAGFVVLGILSCFARMCCGSKKCTKSYDQNLRTFAGEYTSVPQDEKSAKKEKESGSAEMV